MFLHRSPAAPREKRKTPNKLIAGFAALAATAIITAGGFAAAAPIDKPTKEQCHKAGFTNYGQCVKEWAKHKNHPGGGYGNGNVTIINNISLILNNISNTIVQINININNNLH